MAFVLSRLCFCVTLKAPVHYTYLFDFLLFAFLLYTRYNKVWILN